MNHSSRHTLVVKEKEFYSFSTLLLWSDSSIHSWTLIQICYLGNIIIEAWEIKFIENSQITYKLILCSSLLQIYLQTYVYILYSYLWVKIYQFDFYAFLYLLKWSGKFPENPVVESKLVDKEKGIE